MVALTACQSAGRPSATIPPPAFTAPYRIRTIGGLQTTGSLLDTDTTTRSDEALRSRHCDTVLSYVLSGEGRETVSQCGQRTGHTDTTIPQ